VTVRRTGLASGTYTATIPVRSDLSDLNIPGTLEAYRGDQNGDRAIDIIDAVLCVRRVAGLDPVNGDAADVSDDGHIDIADVIVRLRTIVAL